MDITMIPPTAYVAFGVITAALLTGFFSFMNMVSSKENKVSEFRLAWIDGLRNEIAEHISAAQELARVSDTFDFLAAHTDEEKQKLEIERYKETRAAYARATESLSKIQLRLNANHISEDSITPEANLMKAILKAREFSVRGDFDSVIDTCADIRSAAAPILKSTWDLVKRGELGYRRIRNYTLIAITTGLYIIIIFGTYIGVTAYTSNLEKEQNQIVESLKEAIKAMTLPPSLKPNQERDIHKQ